jgi:hypothetical protein
LNGLVGVLQSVVLFFFAGGPGSLFDKRPVLLLEPDEAVETADLEVVEFDDFVEFDGLREAEVRDGGAGAVRPEVVLALAGAGKVVVSELGLSGKAIVGNDAPVDGAPGVNCRLEKPLVPVVFEFDPVCAELEAF